MLLKTDLKLSVTDKHKSSPAANTGFASGGVTCKYGDLSFYSSVVLVDSIVHLDDKGQDKLKPARKARKRFVPLF